MKTFIISAASLDHIFAEKVRTLSDRRKVLDGFQMYGIQGIPWRVIALTIILELMVVPKLEKVIRYLMEFYMIRLR